jgi:hypothetical protein
MTTLHRPRVAAAALVPIAILAPWLALITSAQRALFPRTADLPVEPPILLFAVAAVAALAVRVVVPSVRSHSVALATVTAAVSLAAAKIGAPLANATVDYCGDQCRTAIIGRAASFFGWPIALAAIVALSARADSPDRATWSRRWAVTTLVLGELAAIVWWRTILPNG